MVFPVLLYELCDKPRPARLMACTYPSTVVPMKVFIEKNEVLPMFTTLLIKSLSGQKRYQRTPIRINTRIIKTVRFIVKPPRLSLPYK